MEAVGPGPRPGEGTPKDSLVALHHLRLNVSHLSCSRAFYGPILRWLGFRELDPHRSPDGGVDRCRFEKEGFVFLLSEAGSTSGHDRNAVGLHHLAFAVPSRAHVDAFYQEVLLELPAVVVEDPPVDCPEYRPGYYATYFLDPDGIKLEVAFSP